eukprot:358683-Chlamydomonas_euryale.AAC.1
MLVHPIPLSHCLSLDSWTGPAYLRPPYSPSHVLQTRAHAAGPSGHPECGMTLAPVVHKRASIPSATTWSNRQHATWSVAPHPQAKARAARVRSCRTSCNDAPPRGGCPFHSHHTPTSHTLKAKAHTPTSHTATRPTLPRRTC